MSSSTAKATKKNPVQRERETERETEREREPLPILQPMSQSETKIIWLLIHGYSASKL